VGLLQPGGAIGILAALSILPASVAERFLGASPLFDSVVQILRRAGQTREHKLARRD
jgi:hypothetical protein